MNDFQLMVLEGQSGGGFLLSICPAVEYSFVELIEFNRVVVSFSIYRLFLRLAEGEKVSDLFASFELLIHTGDVQGFLEFIVIQQFVNFFN